jgi:O-antigen/teichoic acid export membrane protein
MNQAINSSASRPLGVVDGAGELVSENPSPRPQTMPAGYRRVVSGTIWSASSRVASILASLLSTAFVTRYLGAEMYGIWSLANSIIAYLGVTEMGTGNASTKFAAEKHARRDEAGEVAVVWTTFLITLIPAGTGILVMMFAAGHIVGEVFGISEHLQPIAATAVRLAAISFGAQLFVGVFNTPQLVRLRIKLFESWNAGFMLAQHCSIVIVVFLGWDIRGVLGVVTAYALLRALAQAFVSRSLLPTLFRPRIDTTLLRPIFRFAKGIVMSLLLGIILTSIEKFFLTRFCSIRDLGYYALAERIATLLNIIPFALKQILMPVFSALHAGSEKSRIENLYSQAMRTILFCGLPVAILICASAEPFLRIWAGAEFAEHSTIPLYILITGCMCGIMGYVPHSLLLASGKTETIARCYFIEIIPYVICASILTLKFGAAGAAIAASLRMLFEAILFFKAARWETGLPLRILSGDWRIYGIALLVIVGAAAASACIGENPIGRMANAVASCALFCGLVWTIILEPSERRALLQIMRPQSGRAQ